MPFGTLTSVWYSDTWAGQGTSTQSVTSANTLATWGYWVGSTATNSVWYGWCDQTGTCYPTQQQPVQEQYAAQAARIIAEQERQALAMEQYKAEAEKSKQAAERAEALLHQYLTDAQRAEHKQHKFFHVTGGKTGHLYRVHSSRGVSGNIEEVNRNGGTVRRLCAHGNHSVMRMPDPDHLLTQKLMIQHHEEDFLKVAHVH